MTQFVYHFHAAHMASQTQARAAGVVLCSEKVDSNAAYQAMRADIAQFMGVPADDDLFITSLTFLHEVP